MKPCTFDDCGRPHDAHGYCAGHNRQRRHGRPLTPLQEYAKNRGRTCDGPECDKPAYTRGLCRGHTAQRQRGQGLTPLGELRPGPKLKYTDDDCRFPGCERVRCRRGHCYAHWQQEVRGEPLTPLPPVDWQNNANEPCAGPECDRPAKTKGLCGGHYAQHQRGRDLTPLGTTTRGQRPLYDDVDCAFVGCGRQARALSWCRSHYHQHRMGRGMHPIGQPPPKPAVDCQARDCGKPAKRKGWCMTHYARVMRTGSPERTPPVKDPVVGRYVLDTGYVLVRRPGHPEAKRRGGNWGYEHRIVMSDQLGRPLLPKEQVHHINGDKADNRAANLQLWDKSQPAGQRVEDKIRWCSEFLAPHGIALVAAARILPARDLT